MTLTQAIKLANKNSGFRKYGQRKGDVLQNGSFLCFGDDFIINLGAFL